MRTLGRHRARLAGFLSLSLLALAIPLSLIGTAQAEVVPSDLSIRWNDQTTKFHGKIRSDVPECRSGRLVRVYKKRPGPDKKVGSDLTNTNGRWVVDKRHANGRYYAKVRGTDIGGYYGQADKCGATRSRTIEV